MRIPFHNTSGSRHNPTGNPTAAPGLPSQFAVSTRCRRPPECRSHRAAFASASGQRDCQSRPANRDADGPAGYFGLVAAGSLGRSPVELAARADGELGEDLGQVVLNRVGADGQPAADLRVRQPLAGQPRDHGLLGGQLLARLDGAFAGGLAGGLQLAAGSLGERLDAHRVQKVVGDAQLLAGVEAAALAAQPLPGKQMRARARPQRDGPTRPPARACP
jgi:hypothetical protein